MSSDFSSVSDVGNTGSPFLFSPVFGNKKSLWLTLSFCIVRFCLFFSQLAAITRVSRPTRPDKARRLGYRAKQGVVIYRVRVKRGNRKRHNINNHRSIVHGKPVNQGIVIKDKRNLRSLAEERVGRRCGNLRVLNSYWVAQDSTYKFFEVILVDVQHKAIRRDPRMKWIVAPVHKHRELRGLTQAGKKARGLQTKGSKSSSTRPSKMAAWKRKQMLSLRRYR